MSVSSYKSVSDVSVSANGNGKPQRKVTDPLAQMVAAQVQRCLRCKVKAVVDAVMLTVPDLDRRIEDLANAQVDLLVTPSKDDDGTTAVEVQFDGHDAFRGNGKAVKVF